LKREIAKLEFLSNVFAAFGLGLLTPLTAVCVLPLYPGFLVYLSSKMGEKSKKKNIAVLGLIVTAGVILFMSVIGLIFTTILQVSLNKVIGVVTPIAFGILLVISILLILDIGIGEIIPKTKTPISDKPRVSALLFGFFFGAIVIPCNPLFIAALFAATLSTIGFLENILTFISFGLGIGFPLLIFSFISTTLSDELINLLSKHKRKINVSSGIVMLVISLYYLFFVFHILG
jgi:cytochrome c-type biogenesis protein